MLTKSNFNLYIKCPIWLWLKIHRPDLLPADSLDTLRRFAEGRDVDVLSRQVYPGGVEAKGFNKEGFKNTKELLSGTAKVIYQPTIMTEFLTCRADILTRDGEKWDLREVKMTTKVKPEHVYDVGFQRICFEEAGVKIGRTFLVHLNNEYVRHGAIEPEKLFISEDITDEVLEKMDEIKEEINKALAMFEWREAPDKRLIELCATPKNCEYIKYYCEGVGGVAEMAEQIDPKKLLILLRRGIVAPENLSDDLLDRIGYAPEEPFTKINAPVIRREWKSWNIRCIFLIMKLMVWPSLV